MSKKFWSIKKSEPYINFLLYLKLICSLLTIFLQNKSIILKVYTVYRDLSRENMFFERVDKIIMEKTNKIYP